MNKLTLLASFLLIVNFIYAQTPIYVSENGSDVTGDGSCLQKAFKTLVKAQSWISQPGQQAYVIKLHGSVNATDASCDSGPLIWTKSGTSNFPITITSDDTTNRATIVRISPEKSHKSSYILKLQGVSFVQIQYINFNDASAGVSITDSQNCSITRCTFNIGFFEPGGGSAAISVGSDSTDATNYQSHLISITRNTINFTDERVLDRCWSDDAGTSNCYDLYHGIYIAHADQSDFSYNTIYNAPGNGIQAEHDYATYNTIANNNIYMCYNHNYNVWDTKYGPAKQVDPTRHAILLTTIAVGSTVHDNQIFSNQIHADTYMANQRTADYNAVSLTNTSSNANFILINKACGSNTTGLNSFVQYAGCASPSNESNDYTIRYGKKYYDASPYYGRHIQIFDFIPNDGETFIAIKESGTILKTTEDANATPNMFGLSYANGSYAIAGNLKGVQQFSSSITDVEYVNGYTLIGFADGRILKINGTGGTGPNMFGTINPDSSGFNSTSVHYSGSHLFLSGIRDITYTQGVTFISFEDKKILKVNGSGGTGYNLFAIQETSSTFSAISGYNFYVGYGLFDGKVTNIVENLGETFICFVNDPSVPTYAGKVLKVAGTGGTGPNMFKVNETQYGFTNLSGYNFYRGNSQFMGYVTKMMADNDHNVLLICLSDGKILKVADNGGTGDNMFAVTETANDFANVSGYSFYIGHTKYLDSVGDLLLVNGYTYLALNNGQIFRIPWTGGSGANVFGGYEGNNDNFFASITDVAHVNGKVYVCFMNGLILRLADGATGDNMFNLVETPPAAVNSLTTDAYTDYYYNCNYARFLYGSQILEYSYPNSYPSGARVSTSEFTTSASVDETLFSVYPNPSQGEINIKFSHGNEKIESVSIYNLFGQQILSATNPDLSVPLFAGNNVSGIHIVKVETAKGKYFQKVLLTGR